jgi:hypothetical protein
MTNQTRYTIEAATEYGAGRGPNGTGRRAKVSGFYVVDTKSNRRCRAFTGKDAEQKATAWAAYCEEHLN